MSKHVGSHQERHEELPEVIFDRSRLAALHEYQILDTEAEPAFDRIATLAAHLFDAPMALVSFLDETRQWVKSTVGFEGTEIDLDASFCVYTVAAGDTVVIEDLTADERFQDNPYVEEDGVRFYAGTPLISPDGARLGTLCVLDTEPRSPTAADLDRLSDLADLVVDELELRREAAERRRADRRRQVQNTFFEFIATGAEIDEVLTELCRFAERELDDKMVSILRREGDRLRHAAAPSLPAQYTDGIDGLTIGPSAGTCGTAAFEDQQIVTEDIHTDARWEGLRTWSEEMGLRSCWSTPIRGGEGRVLGTFAIYGRTPGTPARPEQAFMKRIAHIASVALDRDRRQRALQRSQERFRTVVENAQPIVFMTDAEGTILLSEGKDLSVLGLAPGEVVGASVFELYRDVPGVADHFRRALAGEPVEAEVEIDGRVFNSWISPVYDDDGAVDGCIGMAADITERKQMEDTLQEREERLKLAQRIAHLGYWRRDLRTGALEWSEETRRIFGWDEDKEVAYDVFMEAVHPDDRALLRQAQEAARADEEQIDIEYRIRRPSGEERVVHERGRLQRDENGEPMAIMGAVLDVTRQVRRREQIRAAKEEAEEADRMKTALLSNMSHELRTPLTSIISFSKIIRNNPEFADQFADRIFGGGQRLLYTLNTVMDFAALEGNGLDAEATSVRAGEVAQAVVRDFEKRAQDAGVELRIEAETDTVPVVVEEEHLKRILTHLVHNAIKFTEDGVVTVSVRTEPDAVELQVADTGIGIAPSFLPTVFEEFAQASSGADRTHEGNGLGLTVVKRIVDQMDGTIDVESTPGEGTTVTVHLPVT